MHDIHPFLSTLFNNPGTLLYIGARLDAHSWLEELIQAGNKVVILEVWPENYNELAEYPGLEELVIGDVRKVDEIFIGEFDYIFYWHGPEHLQYSEIEPTLTKLESKCNRLIALACPWGIYPQGAHKGNPYETHQCSLYPEFFLSLGYEVRTDGEVNRAGSEIVAWKMLND